MIALWLLLVLAPAAGAGDAERAYAAGDYERALALFTAELGPDPSAALLYDLGNCSYRLGRYADAIRFYRRAELRAPADEDIRFNRRLSERRLGLGGPAQSPPPPWEGLTPAARLWFLAALHALCLAGLLLRPRLEVRILLSIGLLLALVGAAWVAWEQWGAPPRAVVLRSEIAVRREPHVELAPTLRLGAGETVRVEEASDRWARIRHPRGAGWTERDGLGVVD